MAHLTYTAAELNMYPENPMRLITSITNRTWYTADGQPLLTLNKTTATASGMSFNAEHLRDLAAACLEAAKELEQRAADRTYADQAS